MSGNPFGCRYCEERLQLFMDKVLTDEEIVEVQHHLDDCPPCRGAYRFEATLRMVVHDRTIEPMSAVLKEKLLALRTPLV